MIKEVQLISRIQSPYIVRYLGLVYENRRVGDMEAPRSFRGFLMERMEESLSDHMRKQQFYDPPHPSLSSIKSVLCILIGVCKGLQALTPHRLEAIIHRDLHIGNILLRGNDVKLAELGCGHLFTAAILEKAKGQIAYSGFVAIVPPEAREKEEPRRRYDCSYDIYSFGLLVA